MKKIIILVLLLNFFLPGAYAQAPGADAESAPDNEENYLPQYGDIAIGIDAAPFFNIFGNWDMSFLDGNIELNRNAVFVKYFLADDEAIRVRFQADVSNSTYRGYVDDELAQFQDPLSRDQMVDNYDYSFGEYLLGIDYELRRGYDRVQGYYGFGANFGIFNEKHSFAYANAISELYPQPSSHNFVDYPGNNVNWPNSRILETYNDNNHLITGINLFIGFEYFVLPKIAFGGELGYGIFYRHGSTTKQVVEFWDGNQVVEETTMRSPGHREFEAFTMNPSLGLYFMFHF